MTRLLIRHNGCLNMACDLSVVCRAVAGECELVEAPEQADQLWFAGCGVRGVWVQDAARRINAALDVNPDLQVMVTGCLAAIDTDILARAVKTDRIEFLGFDGILRKHALAPLAELDSGFDQNEETDYERGVGPRERLTPQKRQLIGELEAIDKRHGTQLAPTYRRITKGFIFYHEPEPVGFITISRGCPYRCSYCVIPKGRGKYTSVPSDVVLSKAKRAVASGRKKLYLIGDEVGNYGIGSTGPRLDGLLQDVFSLDRDLRIGLRFIEPLPFMRLFTNLRKHCEAGRLDLLYVPIQSGARSILRRMNRQYDIGDLSSKLAEIRGGTNTVLYTNWMVGFPGETDEESADTATLMERLGLHVNAVIPYSERKGTPAASMGNKTDASVIRERSKTLSTLAIRLKTELLMDGLPPLPEDTRRAIVDAVSAAEAIPADALYD